MSERAHWKSRFGFVLAAAGSAVGLGNIWKFPYITGENGGGLFVLIYLVCIALVGLPIMMAEIMIGRAAQRQPVGAFAALQGQATSWSVIGWMGVFTGFVILSYYAVVAGWAMDYTLKSIVNYARPIHDQAEQEATDFRATASLDEMRDLLVNHDLSRLTQAEVNRVKTRAKPSVWKDYRRFSEAISKADNRESARARLLADPRLKSAVEQVEALQREIDEIEENSRSRLAADYQSLTEAELLKRAETLKRRQITFEKVKTAFVTTAGDGWTTLLWSLAFMLTTIVIVAGGISSGIERTCRILMPTLFVLICCMVGYGMFQPGFVQAVAFVFSPDPSKLKASGVLEALGHAFFTLSLGMGAMITYGSYQNTKRGLLGESIMIAALDTVIALLACLMIFPIIFSYGQEPSAGPGLVFMSMPLAFAEIGKGGMLLAIMFFGLLFFAALTSAISLLEVVASYFIDQQDWKRSTAAWITGGAIFLFGIPSAFAMDSGYALSGWEPSYGINFFDTMDYLASNWMLPLGGMLTAIYAGWVLPAHLRDGEVTDLPRWAIQGWVFCLRIVTPALVAVVLLQKVGILQIDELLVW